MGNTLDNTSMEDASPKGKRKESAITVSTVEILIDSVETVPSPTEEYNNKEEDVKEEEVRERKKKREEKNFTILQNYNLWYNLFICCLLGTGLCIFVTGYFINIVFIDVIGVILIVSGVILILLKCVIHFSSKSEREKVLPYIGFRYRTEEGWLSKQEIFRRETGVKGSSRPAPGPNHFF